MDSRLSSHLLNVFQQIQSLATGEKEITFYQLTSKLDCGLHVLLADLWILECFGLVKAGEKIATVQVIHKPCE